MLVPLLALAMSVVHVCATGMHGKEHFHHSHHKEFVIPGIHHPFIEHEMSMFGYDPAVYEYNDNYNITDVSPRVLANNDVVNVSYSITQGHQGPYDYIGFWSPADADPTYTAPVRFAWCDEDPDYDTLGTGLLTFNMTNLRADGVFYFLTNGTYTPVIRHKADDLTIDFDNYAEPLRPRVMPSGDPDKMWVMWSSDGTAANPQLQYGVEPGVYTSMFDAVRDEITQEELCGAPANSSGWRDMGTINRADMTGLANVSVSGSPRMYYRFGDAATNLWSQECIFNVPPMAGNQPDGRGTRLIMYDDLGRGSTDDSYTWHEYGRPSIYTTMAVGAEVANGTVDAIYHGGDISYATGFLATWDFFLNQLSPVAAGALYLTNLGNHESDWPDSPSFYNGTDSGGECGIPSTRHMPLPSTDGEYPTGTDTGSTNFPWWGYDVGIIHLVGMSTEHDFRHGSEQWEFLKADLAAVNRTKTPWVIFGGHRAMYINSDYDSGFSSDGEVMALLIEHVEPLLVEYGVDLSFYGHNHAVQRHSAIINSEVIQAATAKEDADGNTVWTHEDPGAPVHMVIGTGGATFTENAMYGADQPVWNEMVFYKYGYARVEAVSANELQWEWVEGQSNIVYDRMAIYKGREQPSGDDDDDSFKDKYHEQIIVGSVVGSFAVLLLILAGVWYKGPIPDALTDKNGGLLNGLMGSNGVDSPGRRAQRHSMSGQRNSISGSQAGSFDSNANKRLSSFGILSEVPEQDSTGSRA